MEAACRRPNPQYQARGLPPLFWCRQHPRVPLTMASTRCHAVLRALAVSAGELFHLGNGRSLSFPWRKIAPHLVQPGPLADQHLQDRLPHRFNDRTVSLLDRRHVEWADSWSGLFNIHANVALPPEILRTVCRSRTPGRRAASRNPAVDISEKWQTGQKYICFIYFRKLARPARGTGSRP